MEWKEHQGAIEATLLDERPGLVPAIPEHLPGTLCISNSVKNLCFC